MSQYDLTVNRKAFGEVCGLERPEAAPHPGQRTGARFLWRAPNVCAPSSGQSELSRASRTCISEQRQSSLPSLVLKLTQFNARALRTGTVTPQPPQRQSRDFVVAAPEGGRLCAPVPDHGPRKLMILPDCAGVPLSSQ